MKKQITGILLSLSMIMCCSCSSRKVEMTTQSREYQATETEMSSTDESDDGESYTIEDVLKSDKTVEDELKTHYHDVDFNSNELKVSREIGECLVLSSKFYENDKKYEYFVYDKHGGLYKLEMTIDSARYLENKDSLDESFLQLEGVQDRMSVVSENSGLIIVNMTIKNLDAEQLEICIGNYGLEFKCGEIGKYSVIGGSAELLDFKYDGTGKGEGNSGWMLQTEKGKEYKVEALYVVYNDFPLKTVNLEDAYINLSCVNYFGEYSQDTLYPNKDNKIIFAKLLGN